MLDQIKKWGHNTTNNKITWHHARIAIRSTIGRTLAYPLVATAFDSKQCKMLQSCFLEATLGKTGIVRTAPSIIAIAPTSLGGFGFMSFEIEQLIQHLGLIMQHGPDQTSTTGRLLRATLEYYALDTGLSGDPLSLPYAEYATRKTWISTTITALRKHGISISSGGHGLTRWCSNDTFIMEHLFNKLPYSTLCIVNKVRLYLRVVTLSDMVSADGSQFDREMLQGIKSCSNPQPSYYRYIWPHVDKPTTFERTTWTQIICSHFDIDLTYGRRRATTSTYHWYTQSFGHSMWMLSRSTGMVYERTSPCPLWRMWTPQQNQSRYTTRNNTTYLPLDSVTAIPADALPVSVKKLAEQLSVTSYWNNYGVGSPQQQSPTTIKTVDLTPSLQHYLYHIILRNGIIFSDGSFDGTSASYAILAQPQGHFHSLRDVDFSNMASFSGMVDGSSWDMNSYRAELRGILAAIELTNTICSNAHVHDGVCTLYCDSKGALYAAFGHKRPTPRWASFDIVSRIRKAIATSAIQWKFHHVKGHQDSHCPFSQLDYYAQGNAMVDHLASLQIRAGGRPATQVEPTPWIPVMNNQPISGELPTRLRYNICRPIMESRWSAIVGIPEDCYNRCLWDIFFRSLQSQPTRLYHSIIKYNARLLPVGKNMLRRKHSQHGTCPGCGAFEDHDHLLICHHPEMQSAYDTDYEDLRKWLDDTTSNTLKTSVLSLLQLFRAGEPHQDQQSLSSLVTAQYNMGSRAFFAGIWHDSWLHHQDIFYRQNRIQRSSTIWLIHLLHRIQIIPIHMWQARNLILHSRASNVTTQAQHDELNSIIDSIFVKKPHPRLMSHCDNMYFTKHAQDTVKNMKLHRKNNWIAGANLILMKYDRATTNQSARFTSFFQWNDNG
jgi:hypothetical protein